VDPEGGEIFVLKIVQDFLYSVSALWIEESNGGQRMRRLGIFMGRQLWKRVVRKPITVTLFNGKRFKAYPDCPVSSGVLYARMPNSRNITFLRKHVSEGTLIDVGANVGSVSLLLADMIQNAILFEPNLVAAARARENLALNQLGFEVCEVTLSGATGEIRFECNGAVDVGAHVVVTEPTNLPSTRVVQRIPFDEFLRQHGDPVFPVSLVRSTSRVMKTLFFAGCGNFLPRKDHSW
jgi:FkbM family methyltransferase